MQNIISTINQISVQVENLQSTQEQTNFKLSSEQIITLEDIIATLQQLTTNAKEESEYDFISLLN